MFYGKMEEHKLYKPIYEIDECGERTTTYKQAGTARMFISVQDRSYYSGNDLNLLTSTLVGYTENTKIQENWKIDMLYVVESVIPHRQGCYVYLKKIEDGR